MICIPITSAKQSEALEMIEKSAGLADVLELRMDLLAQCSLKKLISAVRAASSSSVRTLVTNRPAGPFDAGDEEVRIGVLLEAVSLGADFVDLELAAPPVWKEKIRRAIAKHGDRTRLIISHHDFQRTPSRKSLIGYFNKSVKAGAGIVKIVTTACSPEDNLSVLGLIPYARERNVDIIAFCMGEQGRISRVAAPLLGAFFTFASLERGSESAAGQLTVHEMMLAFRILEGKGQIEG